MGRLMPTTAPKMGPPGGPKNGPALLFLDRHGVRKVDPKMGPGNLQVFLAIAKVALNESQRLHPCQSTALAASVRRDMPQSYLCLLSLPLHAVRCDRSSYN